MTSREGGNLSCRTSNTATDIENPHSLSDVDHVCHVMLVSGQGLLKGLSLVETAEVKGPRPSYLVLVRSQIIVAFYFSFSILSHDLYHRSLLVD